MTSFYEVSKNQYPYHTLHTDKCGVISRSRYATGLSREHIGRYDTIRVDWCKKCFPETKALNEYGNAVTTYSEAWYEFMHIVAEKREEDRRSSQEQRAARVIASLELALENANAEYVDFMTPRAVELLIEYRENMRNGVYTPATVEVGR